MKFKSIRSHFSFYIVLLFAAFSVALFIISYLSAENIREKLAIRYSNMYSDSVKNRIANLVQKSISASLQMSKSPVVLKWLKPGLEDSYKKFFFKNIKNIQEHLAKNTDIFVCRNDNYHYYMNFKYIETISPNALKDAWYFNTIKQKSKFNLNIDFNPALNALKLWINVPVKVKNRVVGIIGTGENIGLFLNKVLQTKEKGTSIILIDEKGKIKAHKNRRLVEKSNIFNVIDDKKAVQKINKILEYLKTDSLLTGSLYISFNKEKYYAAIKYIKSIKWYQIVLVKTNELIKLSYFFPLIATGIISFVIFFALIIVITEKIIIIPIALLNKNVASVSKGNFNIKSEITSEDELGTLQKTFTKMACTVKDYTENLEEKVRVRTCELKNKNLLILDSINYAKRLQTSVLPDEESLKSCFKEHFILWKPKDIVGGDFYWLKKLEDGNFVFAVADCTGHGVPGALMAMLAATLLSGVVSNKCNSDPALILTELDKELRAALKQDNVKTQSNDGLEIGLCLCRPKENTLIYAGSKLMLISVYDKTITITKGDKSKIGYKKQKKSLPFRSTNHIINYKKGTFFYISSDGYYDQNGLNSEYPFGKKKFVNMLKSFYSISMQEQAGYAESAITHFMGDIPQRDDITLAGFKL